jgi:hypothetical protein
MKSLSAFLGACVLITNYSGRCDTNISILNVSAWIDGTSRLVITTNALYWDHRAFHQPGRSDGHNYATYLDGFPWFPQWTGAVDEIATSAAIATVTSFPSNIVDLKMEAGREKVQILQQPNESNGQTLIVEFDDGETAGATWYRVSLSGINLEYQVPLAVQVACVNIDWFARSNRVYQLQYTTNFQSPVWLNVGGQIQGFGTNVSIMDCAPGSPHRYYRTIIVP